jgi:hypothetical protein
VDLDWRSLLGMPTPEIVRRQAIAGDDGAGILWSSDGGESRELSARACDVPNAGSLVICGLTSVVKSLAAV